MAAAARGRRLFSGMFDLAQALTDIVERGASDLHLHVGNGPLARVHGRLVPLYPGHPPFAQADMEELLRSILIESRIKEFEEEHELDFAYSVQGLARFRVNAFRQRGAITLVMRALPYAIPTIEQLGLPDVVHTIAAEERGIVLVTGTTGSGKSSTLAAMIGEINEHEEKHIVTIEDPIEFLHRDGKCEVNQREIGPDTASFKRALRRVLRQDPDVILIGEMRDEETVQTALSAAETGHLVFSTLHTVDAGETVNRIIEFFPPHQQNQVRSMLAGTLKAIISQRLVPSADGGSRVPLCEVLRVTGRIRDMVLDPEKTGELPDAIAEGGYYGMQTFDQALYEAYEAGKVDMDVAMRVATKPHDFKLLVGAGGHLGTSMDDVLQDEPADVLVFQTGP